MNRLSSLDILRGFDLWLLVFIGPIASSFCRVSEGPLSDFLRIQTEHAEWSGFTTWDIIMPLFIFMSGITIPFSVTKFQGKKLLRRFVLLFVLGWIVQGNLLDFQWNQFHPLANTLQAIAISYTVTAIAFVLGGVRLQLAVTIAFFAIYFISFALCGHLNPDFQENVAMWVDKAVLGSHRDGVIWNTDGSWSYDAGYCYTWILSSLNFVVTCMIGCFTGHILRNSTCSKLRRALYVMLLGLLLLVSGILLDSIFPIIKRLWTSSMTLFSGGICSIMMAVTYYIVDVKGCSKGLNWLKYYGMNSILAYCIGETINFSSVSNSLLHGFEPILGAYYGVLVSLANAVILLLLLRYLYKRKIFVRV